MVPKEISFIKRPVMDFFLAITRLPPQEVQRIPSTVRLIMILSKSTNGITGSKIQTQKKTVK
jgi:hypothetical protein